MALMWFSHRKMMNLPHYLFANSLTQIKMQFELFTQEGNSSVYFSDMGIHDPVVVHPPSWENMVN